MPFETVGDFTSFGFLLIFLIFRIWICVSVRNLRAFFMRISCDEFATSPRVEDFYNYRGNCTFSFINAGKDKIISIYNPKIIDIHGWNHDVTPKIYLSGLSTRASTRFPIKYLKIFQIWNRLLQIERKLGKSINYASKTPPI